MPKWEYCVLTGIKGSNFYPHYPRLQRFTLDGYGLEDMVDFGKRPKGLTELTAVAQAIARLGEDGWEMVSAGSRGRLDDTYCIYFKRPKPQIMEV